MERSIAPYCQTSARIRLITKDKWGAKTHSLDFDVVGRFEKTTGKIKDPESQNELQYNAIFYMPPIAISDYPDWPTSRGELGIMVYDKIQVPTNSDYDTNVYGIIKTEGNAASDSRATAAQSKAFITLYLE